MHTRTHTHLPSLTLPCSHRCCFPPLPHKHTHSRVLLMQGCTHTQECTSQVGWQTAILCPMSWSTVDRPVHTAGVSLEPPLLIRIKGDSTLEGSQCQSTRESWCQVGPCDSDMFLLAWPRFPCERQISLPRVSACEST